LADIYVGDCAKIMQENIKDGSVALTVTSPPYDNLRKYGGKSSWSFDVFSNIANQLYRVTMDGGVIVWITADATVKGSETGTSFKQALYFRDIGFNLHDTMIYAKKCPMPLNHNRYEQQFEYMFVISKGKPKTFNPLKEPCKGSGKVVKKRTHRKTGEELITFTTSSGPIKSERFRYNIWYAQHAPFQDPFRGEHPAPFPRDLAEDLIFSWSNEGDIVLDPFAGSGTTLAAAEKLGRKSIGIEINEEYIPLIQRKLDLYKKAC